MKFYYGMAVKPLLKRCLRELQSKDLETRCRAAVKLGKTGDTQAARALADIVVSGNPLAPTECESSGRNLTNTRFWRILRGGSGSM